MGAGRYWMRFSRFLERPGKIGGFLLLEFRD